MMGFPTETEEDIRATIDVACASKSHSCGFFTMIPFPGTEMYELAMATHPERLNQIKYNDSDYNGILINLSEVPDKQFFRWQRRAWRRFLLNPDRISRLLRDFPDRQQRTFFLVRFMMRQLKGVVKTETRESSACTRA
jgi:radical SAM superfamily enzyme YgiQ (UPF0313 family)